MKRMFVIMGILLTMVIAEYVCQQAAAKETLTPQQRAIRSFGGPAAQRAEFLFSLGTRALRQLASSGRDGLARYGYCSS
jgi:hypothetical protein